MSRAIAKTFNRHHHDYTQVERKGDICLYSYTREDSDDKDIRGYEVVKLYTDKHGVEYFPGTSLWGINGFTYVPSQLAEAKKRFDKMYKASLIKKPKRVVKRKKSSK